jgi:hypothetical protein
MGVGFGVGIGQGPDPMAGSQQAGGDVFAGISEGAGDDVQLLFVHGSPWPGGCLTPVRCDAKARRKTKKVLPNTLPKYLESFTTKDTKSTKKDLKTQLYVFFQNLGFAFLRVLRVLRGPSSVSVAIWIWIFHPSGGGLFQVRSVI